MLNNTPQQKVLLPSLMRAFLLFCLALPAAAKAVAVGEPAPFFELEGLQQKTYTLKDFENKVVFVNFWASWCSPCRKELPLLDKLQTKYKDLIVLAINIDSEKQNAMDFLQNYKVKSQVLFDPTTNVVSRYGAIAMPTSYILDQRGVVRYSHYGFNPKKDPSKWDSEVMSLLGMSE